MTNLDLSVVIPLFNEQESLSELSQWIIKVCEENKISFEIYFIDDGSTDHSWNSIESLAKNEKELLLLQWMLIYRIIQMKFQS